MSLHWLPLAHHRRNQAHRCVHVPLPLGQRRLALCARCLGLYPTLAAALALQAALGIGGLGAADLYLVLGLSAPGLLDWGAGVVEPASGSNARRVITGILLGGALGRSLWLHFSDPRHEVLWVQILLVIFTTFAVLLVKRIRPEEGM